MTAVVVPPDAIAAARELRTKRRTRAGVRWRPWVEIADELARRGLGRFDPTTLAEACGNAAAAAHPLAPLLDADRERLERSWREGFAVEFPGEPWPGLRLAQERIRTKWARSGS